MNIAVLLPTLNPSEKIFKVIDGLFDKNPKEFPDARIVETVNDIDSASKNVSIGELSSFGTGGIATKLDAAQRALPYGIPVILANGGKPRCLEALAEGRQKGTVFLG